MDTLERSQTQIILSYILPPLCCIIIGFIIFGKKIFEPHVTLFQFVIVPIQASIIFNILKDTNLRNSIATAFVLFIVNPFLTGNSFNWAYLFRDVLLILVVFFSVYLFFRIFYLAVKPYFYPLAFGLLLVFLYFIAISVLLIVHSVPEFWMYVNMQMMIGGLIGVGLGTGILINDKLSTRLRENKDTNPQDE